MTQPAFVDVRRDLFARLIDFAPAPRAVAAGLSGAVEHYRTARQAAASWTVGSFVVSASALESLAGLLIGSMHAAEPPWPIKVVVDGDPSRAASQTAAFDLLMAPAAVVVAIEAPLPAAADEARRLGLAARAVAAGPRVVFAVPPAAMEPADAVDRIAALRESSPTALGAALRCVGPRGAIAAGTVAEFLIACRDRALPFAMTGGLRHAVRRTDPQHPSAQHGFVNLLVAAALAEAGAGRDDVAGAVAETDAASLKVGSSAVAWGARRVGEADVRLMRSARLVSIAADTLDEPIDALSRLGLLTPVVP